MRTRAGILLLVLIPAAMTAGGAALRAATPPDFIVVDPEAIGQVFIFGGMFISAADLVFAVPWLAARLRRALRHKPMTDPNPTPVWRRSTPTPVGEGAG